MAMLSNTAMILNMAMIGIAGQHRKIPVTRTEKESARAEIGSTIHGTSPIEFEKILADAFRKAGWRPDRHLSARDVGADLFLDRKGKRHVVQLKVASEGRRDRLIPLLSQAILEARAATQTFPKPAIPLAVIAAKHIPASVADQVKTFARRYAPEVGVGAIDAEGLRLFVGPDLEGLDSKPARRLDVDVSNSHRPPELFSDLNQWMLKILLGQSLPEPLISVPRQQIRNASQLARAANISIMSASRFLNQLSDRGFLDRSKDLLRILRLDELCELWISANRDANNEIPTRWNLKKGPDQLQSSLREYAAPHPAKNVVKSVPRCCLALFAAADALGYGFVRGAPSYIYLERLTLDALHRLGLAVDRSNRPADVYIRIPANREAVFRASVMRNGVPASDILQVWLDASTHPARGKEQAREIRQRVFKTLFGKR
jgi:hypothetical protein